MDGDELVVDLLVLVVVFICLKIVVSGTTVFVNLLVEVSFCCDESLMHTSEKRVKFKFR